MIHFARTTYDGFVVGDDQTGRTAYAYPSSEHAEQARKTPEKVAAAMLEEESRLHCSEQIQREYDARNWVRLRSPNTDNS